MCGLTRGSGWFFCTFWDEPSLSLKDCTGNASLYAVITHTSLGELPFFSNDCNCVILHVMGSLGIKWLLSANFSHIITCYRQENKGISALFGVEFWPIEVEMSEVSGKNNKKRTTLNAF